MTHTSVLLNEVISGLDIKPDEVCLDGTINGGGHSEAMLRQLGSNGIIVGLDLDGKALEKAKVRLSGGKAQVILKQISFRNLDTALIDSEIKSVNKIILDLGLSSNQFEESGRGFSFQKDEPLLMTFNNNPKGEELTARKIVNEWDEENIAQIIESYGEERFAKKIAHAIVFTRGKSEIKTTTDLVKIIKEAVPKKYQTGRIHPATKTFQALRITVNDEIGALKDGLVRGFKSLSDKGRMAIISFHSIEDRIVKRYFKELSIEKQGKLITKKPITPTQEEENMNPRSRSAKLRIIEKISK
ncbi:MAG: 16S rRNA (cytosine(1402)-N(4))-methyltransferase RsmH [Candidatus Taylorbacteria bacterium]|nr:16S rRNA (cytosine(1402)-N(4))-methyltransferase RsmH [Candidatus Taylorbacteria bacterium]